MSARTDTKAARLVAFAVATELGLFDPATVNMSELARLLGVHRATILRDLGSVQVVIDESKRIQALLCQTPVTETHRHK